MKDISNINNKNNIFECQLISFFLKVSTLLKMQIMFIMAGRLKKSQKYQHLILHFQELTFRLFELCLYYGHIWRISKSTKISTFWFILKCRLCSLWPADWKSFRNHLIKINIFRNWHLDCLNCACIMNISEGFQKVQK